MNRKDSKPTLKALKSWQIAIPAALIILAFFCCAGLIFLLGNVWNTPLGNTIRMPLPIITPSATAHQNAGRLESDTVAQNTATAIAKAGEVPGLIFTSLPPTPTPKPLCGGPEVMYILGIGADSRSDTYLYGLADVIRVARVDFVTPKITVLTIPRDLWVEIPDISDHYGITHGKVNQAYLYGNPGMGYYDGPGEGPGLLARTLEKNFGLRPERYGAVNMVTFARIVDALGGIDIYLEEDVDGEPIDDTTEDMGYFYAGQQHLTGNEALRLARIRKKYSTFKREENQTLVMCAIREKLLSPAVLPKIPQLVGAFQDNLRTDLTPAEISQLLCLLPKVSRDNLLFTSFPEEMFESSRMYDPLYKIHTIALEADFEELNRYVEDFKQGTWPSQPEEPACP